MASRILLRRFARASCRFPQRETGKVATPVSHAVQIQPQILGQTGIRPESYSQIKSLCTSTKKGVGMVINIQDTNDFEKRVINSDIPVVVDFHASWCGPCKLLGPRLESLVGSKEGKVILAKVDVDEIHDIVARYKISSVPTVMAFRKKEKVGVFVGLKDDDVIDTFLEKLIG